MANIDQTKQYNIQASSRGTYLSADPSSSLTLTNNQTSALAFSITTSTHDVLKWNFCTRYTSGNSFCLDQYGNNATQAVLGAAGWYSGQEWSLISSPDQAWRMQSDFAGSGRYLAAVGSNAYMLADAPVADTYWKFVAAAVTFSTASTATTTRSMTVSTSPTTITSSSLSQDSTVSSISPTSSTTSPANTPRRGNDTFSTGAIVGVAIGAAVIVIGVVAFVWWYRRGRSKQTHPHQPALPPMKAMAYQQSSSWPGRKYPAQAYVSEVPAYSRVELDTGPRYEVVGQRYAHELDSGRRG